MVETRALTNLGLKVSQIGQQGRTPWSTGNKQYYSVHNENVKDSASGVEK